jgi:hypothetical protein
MNWIRTFATLGLIQVATGQNFIRQIQSSAGHPLIYDIPILSDEGSVWSNILESDSAIFQLYAVETGVNGTQTLKKLDEKTVGTFVPQVEVRFFSEDPHFPPRTRADKAYGASIIISGMQQGPDVPSYARELIVTRGYEVYDSETYQPTGTSGEYADAFNLRTNGSFTDHAIIQRIPGMPKTPTKVAGTENIRVLTQPEAGWNLSELANAEIQIWPVATASIHGIRPDRIYRDLPKQANMTAFDLYPDSVTYAQVYAGEYVLGTIGTPLPSTVVSFDTYLPQNVKLALGDLGELLQEDGTYTLEVHTITPFNDGAPEVLSHVTFTIDRKIEVNSMLYTSE